MTRAHAAKLATALDASKAPCDLGHALVSELHAACHADAVVAWLPRHPGEALDPAHVFSGGPLAWTLPLEDIVDALPGDGLEAWLCGRGFGRAVCVSRPPHVGWIAVAWQNAASEHPEAAAELELLATTVASHLQLVETSAREASTKAVLRDAEQQLARAQRQRTTGELASGLVHDFNNCLTTILGFTEMAVAPLAASDTHYAELMTIRTAALDAAVLVRRLQAISHRRRTDDDREVVDLREIAASMPEITRPRWTRRAELDGVRFDLVVDAQPAPAVHVVVTEIRELLLNLLFNAFDAMPSGGRITIATRTVDGFAEVAVRDDGTGMPPEVLSHLFEPFFSTKGERGSGLGLSVCRNIAERHGGSITVESTVGVGSAFILRLPPAAAVAVTAGEGEAADVSAKATSRARATKAPKASSRRILLVDDQEEVRESVGEMLRALGHEVVAVADGAEAIATAKGRDFDVVITDYGMPGMNGAEVATSLRTDVPNLPVGLITGWGFDADAPLPENVAFALGKPITMKALGDAIGACGAGSAGMTRQGVACS